MNGALPVPASGLSDQARDEARFSPAANVLSYAILLGGLLTIVLAAYTVVISYSSLPFADGWTQISAAARGELSHPLAWLWHQHNEHRLVIPKLFLIADLRWVQARQTFLLASIFATQLVLLASLAWSMRMLGGWHGALWRTGVGLAAFCLFCPSQWENLIWGFQTCFVLPGLFATLSFIALLLYWRKAKPTTGNDHAIRFLIFSILAALGATYSLANGSLLWPLLALAAWLLGLRLAAVPSFVLVGTVSTALYFHHYTRPSQHASPLSSIASPARLMAYVTAYFGSSWVRSDISLAMIIGAAALLVAIAMLLRWKSYVRNARAFCMQLVLTLLFCLGTGLLTASGRMNFGIPQAFSSRYQTVALLFWCCLGLLTMELAASRQKRNALLAVQSALLVVILAGATQARFPLRDARGHGFQLNATAAGLVMGGNDPDQVVKVFPRPDYVLALMPYMREQRLSVFSGALPDLLGKPLDSAFGAASPAACTGNVESTTAIGDSGLQTLRIAGWAWDVEHHRPPLEVVAASDGVIDGLAAVGDWRPTIRATRRWMKTSFIGFGGYVRNPRAESPVKLYAILRGSPASACYFASLSP